MPKLEFNPEFDPSDVTHTIHERVRLREDIQPISGQIVDFAKGNKDLEVIQEIMENDGEIHWVDFEGGDLDKLIANGFKNDGAGSYLISPIEEKDWFTDHLFHCTSVVAIGRDAKTGKEISFLSHQHPEYFIDGGSDKVKNFSQELSDSLKKLIARSQKDTVEVVLLGGNFNPAATYAEYVRRHYRQSIEKLRQIVQDSLGFDPTVLTGPNNNVGSETVITVETQERKVWVERSKQPAEFDKPYQADRLDEAEKNWSIVTVT